MSDAGNDRVPAECVLDASVLARWWVARPDDPFAADARRLLRVHGDGRLRVHVPELALVETADVLWKAVRSGDWPPFAGRRAARDLVALQLEAHAHGPDVEPACGLALEYGVTVYDALYVALARRLGVPVYTADARLARRLGPDVPEVRLLARAG